MAPFNHILEMVKRSRKAIDADYAGDEDHRHEKQHHHHHNHHKLSDNELSLRAKIFMTLEEAEYSYTARLISAFLNFCIFMSVVVFIMGTMPSFQHQKHGHCHAHMMVGRLCHGPDGGISSITAINPHTTEERQHHKSHRILATEAGSFDGEYCEPICEPEPDKEIEIAEGFAMAVFTVDYLLRMLTVHAVPYRLLNPEGYAKHRDLRHYEPHGVIKTIHHFFHVMNLVDLLALVPYYFRTIVERLVPEVAELGILRVFRLLRVFRVAPFYMHMVVSTHGVVESEDKPHFLRVIDLTWLFNILRLGDYAEGAPLFFTTLRSSYPAIIVFLIFTVILTIVMGTLYHMAERGHWMVNEEYTDGAYLVHNGTSSHVLVEGAHSNIFMSMMYVISDTTTMPTLCMLQPVTIIGELLDVGLDYMALLVITLPVAIVARNFHDQYESFFRGWDFSDSSWSDSEEEDDVMDDYDAAVLKLSTSDLDIAAKDSSGPEGMYPWGKQTEDDDDDDEEEEEEEEEEDYDDEEVKLAMPDTPSGSSTTSSAFKQRV